MRALFLKSSFSRWVLPVRLIGLATGLLGLSFIVRAADATAVVVAIVGTLIWHVGTLLEERSAEFRLLKRTPARDAMLTERIDVPSWMKVARVRESFPAVNDRTFFVTLQNGYELGIVLPAQLRAMSDEDARHLPIGRVAQHISNLRAVREDDPLLAAFETMARYRLRYMTVLGFGERLVGVVTSEEVARFSPGRTPEGRSRMDGPSNELRKDQMITVGNPHSAVLGPTLHSR